jgi:hypothetical protein
VETSPTNDIFVAYQDNQEVDRIGPILLTTPDLYLANESRRMNSNATCWEILTLRLGQFARKHIETHGSNSFTDEMLQREARMILYGDADGWEQTAADNPEWLNLFKKAHGIHTTTEITGKSGCAHNVFGSLLSGVYERSLQEAIHKFASQTSSHIMNVH